MPEDNYTPEIIPITNKQIKDITGQTFGRLTVLGYVGCNERQKSVWLCACECGGRKVTLGHSLRHGVTRSCGCLDRDQHRDHPTRKKHGMEKTPEYQAWVNMRRRCYDEKNASYASYGGRGITVCEQWRSSFEAFYADMGPRPGPEYSVDRIDCNGPYAPGNTRWATTGEQANNRRSNHVIDFRGEVHTLAQWAAIVGIPSDIIHNRIRLGWSIEDALTIPVKKRPKSQ